MFIRCLTLLALSAAPATAQQVVVSVKPQTGACLVAHEDRYLAVPRRVILFSPDHCPQLGREGVLREAQSDPGTGETVGRLVYLTHDQFRCLTQKLALALATDDGPVADQDPLEGSVLAQGSAATETPSQESADEPVLEVTLDCSEVSVP